MKRLDFHIHTISTASDAAFEFSMDKLVEYVEKLRIDAIAITNHNTFDLDQYNHISESLKGICEVFPGIEINIGIKSVGHLLCIAEKEDAEDFADKARGIEQDITDPKSMISPERLKEIFQDFSKYLWIPHYEKKPYVDRNIIESMGDNIQCGEVPSVKKFLYCQRRSDTLIPVFFSDLRICDELTEFPARQTLFDIDEISIKSVKKTLVDRNHVALTEDEGHSMFYALPDLPLSTGLNIVIGKRSSGKTFLLDQIAEQNEGVKYIKQFDLIKQDASAAKAENQFEAEIEEVIDNYYELFRDAISIVKDISIEQNDRDMDEYVSALIKHAKEQDRADAFSKCALYNESKYSKRDPSGLKELISAVEKLLDTREYRGIIEYIVPRDTLLLLRRTLLETQKAEAQREAKKTWVNGVIDTIKKSLRHRTSATTIPEIDFYDIQMDCVKVRKFNLLASTVKQKSIIKRKQIGGFTLQIESTSFNNPKELRAVSKKREGSFKELMGAYKDDPYYYLRALTEMDGIKEEDYFRLFVKTDFEILNQYGYPISGGERAEFNLLREIDNANQYDILLIDEPESSFDNIFLRERVNRIIKEISRTMPVILVTHNNTVGASIKPDYLVYTVRETGEDIRYDRFFGFPSSKELKSWEGRATRNIEAVLDCLEAGEVAYDERKKDYEMLKS